MPSSKLLSPSARLTHLSGVFDTALLGKLNGLSLTSWNARALLCSDPVKRRAKINFLVSLLKRYDIVLVQEVHSNSTDLRMYAHRFSTHTYYYDPGPDNGT
eukprot:4545989-Karenia_brevis.AAC.1